MKRGFENMNDLRVGPGAMVAALVLVCLSGVPACESSGTQMPVIADVPEPVALTERDIANHRAYFASTKETLFFSLESADGDDDPAATDTGGKGYDVAPFLVEEPQTISLCPDKGDASYEVEIDQGGAAVLSASSGKCATATLDAGSYELKLTRDAGAGRAPPMPMFVHSVTDASQCPTDVDPFAKSSSHWLVTTQRGWLSGAASTIVAGGTNAATENLTFVRSEALDPVNGVHFTRLSPPYDAFVNMNSNSLLPVVAMAPNLPRRGGVGGPLAFVWFFRTGFFPGLRDAKHIFKPVAGTDWSFRPSVVVDGIEYPWTDPKRSDAPWIYVGTPADGGTNAAPMTVTLAMRVYDTPAGIDTTPLGVGEVALTPSSGKLTYVINDANEFPSDFSKIVGMGGGPYTIRTGCDTSVNLYTGASYLGAGRFVGKSTSVDTPAVLSARVLRTKKILIATNRCTGCNLAGINLSGYTLGYVKLTDVDMTNANLSNAVLDNATLDGVNLDGANLVGTSFLGTTFKNVGLTGTDLRQTNLDALPKFMATVAADPCATGPIGNDASRLARTRATLKELPPATWRYLDMSDVTLDPPGVAAAGLSLEGADVCGSRLARASFKGWNLKNARFDKSDLTGTNLQSVTGSGASFRGATLTRTDLSGAVLANPSFDGATGDDAVFDDVTFTGGSMVEATMSGLQAVYASFTGFDMTRTSFEGEGPSSFYGATFTSSKLDSARLSNVFMNFATFTGGSMVEAKLVQTSFIDSVFSATNLTGVDARSAELTGAAFFNVDMTNAVFAPAAIESRSASFEHAVFCGGTFASTDLSSALLTGALFPTADTTLPSAAGPLTCLAVSVQGFISTNNTICPNGRKPLTSACTGAEWTVAAPPAPPCCDPGTQTCRYLKAGNACKADCDCKSKKCASSGVCAE
jgi:uncharacterized protein YjbI with pentapeptide repeats